MVTVILVRHGPTKTSQNHDLIEGWSDTEITDEGKRSVVETFLKICDNYQVTAMKSSRLIRARQTAAIGEAILNVPLEFTTLLVERNFGLLEGKRWSEIMAEHGPEIRERDKTNTYDYRPWIGDSVEDVRRRLKQFELWMKRDYDNQIVVAVTHGGILRLLGFDVPWRASAEYKVLQW